MDHSVMVVPDYALHGVKRVMVERHDRPAVLILAESVMDNWNFLQEWERTYGGGHERVCLRASGAQPLSFTARHPERKALHYRQSA